MMSSDKFKGEKQKIYVNITTAEFRFSWQI